MSRLILTMRSVGTREMQHRSVDLRRNVKGRSKWSRRLRWCQKCDSVIGRKSRLCRGLSRRCGELVERNASTGALTYGGMLKDGVNGVDGLRWCQKRDSVIGRKSRLCHRLLLTIGELVERNASTGALTYGGMLKDGVNGVDGLDGAQGLSLSSDGKHAYVAA